MTIIMTPLPPAPSATTVPRQRRFHTCQGRSTSHSISLSLVPFAPLSFEGAAHWFSPSGAPRHQQQDRAPTHIGVRVIPPTQLHQVAVQCNRLGETTSTADNAFKASSNAQKPTTRHVPFRLYPNQCRSPLATTTPDRVKYKRPHSAIAACVRLDTERQFLWPEPTARRARVAVRERATDRLAGRNGGLGGRDAVS